MTRILALFILSLHVMADFRKRLHFGALYLTLVSLILILFATFIAADASVPKRSTNPAGVASGLVHRLLKADPIATFKQKSGRVSTYDDHATVQNAKTDNSQSVQQLPLSPSQHTDTISASTGATLSTNTETPAKSDQLQQSDLTVQLATIRMVCRQGNAMITIPSAQVAFTGPVRTSEELTWYWESNIGTSVSSSLPVAPDHFNLVVPAGTSSTEIDNSDVSSPLLSAPEMPGFAYAVRIHVLAPADATSDWVTIPRSNNEC